MGPALSLLWELRGRTGKPVTCTLQADGPRYHLVILIGEMEFHRESYRAEPEALGQAAFFLNDLLGNGWTEVYRRDIVI